MSKTTPRVYTWRHGDADAPTDALPPSGFPSALLYFNSGVEGEPAAGNPLGLPERGFAELTAAVTTCAPESVQVDVSIEAFAPTQARAEALARETWDRVLGHAEAVTVPSLSVTLHAPDAEPVAGETGGANRTAAGPGVGAPPTETVESLSETIRALMSALYAARHVVANQRILNMGVGWEQTYPELLEQIDDALGEAEGSLSAAAPVPPAPAESAAGERNG